MTFPVIGVYLGNDEQPKKGHFCCTGIDCLFTTIVVFILMYFVEIILDPKQCYPP